MSDITLTVWNLKKSEANAIVKAMDKLVELGQIKDTTWVMNNDVESELDSNLMRDRKKNRKHWKSV